MKENFIKILQNKLHFICFHENFLHFPQNLFFARTSGPDSPRKSEKKCLKKSRESSFLIFKLKRVLILPIACGVTYSRFMKSIFAQCINQILSFRGNRWLYLS